MEAEGSGMDLHTLVELLVLEYVVMAELLELERELVQG
jgi:hypothetical protein